MMADARDKRIPDWPLLWVLGNLLVIFLFMADFRATSGGVIGDGSTWGKDFINVWTSGKAVLGGRTDLIYDLKAYQLFQESFFGRIGPHNYSYPPFTLLLMIPFALLPYVWAWAAWLVLTGWLFLKAGAPWWSQATGWRPLFLLLTPAALVNMWTGHYGFLIGALYLLGWRNLQLQRPVLAGICFGLMAIKPHIAVLIPLVLVIRREWKAISAAALTVAALILTSLVAFGPEPWHAYLTQTTGFQSGLIDAQGRFFGALSTSVATALLELGAARPIVIAGQLCASVTGIALTILAARKARLPDLALLTATATFLVLPYAFNYDLTVSAMGAAILMYRATLNPFERAGAIMGFLAPQLGLLLALSGIHITPILLFILAMVQYRASRREPILPPVAAAQQAKP